MEQNWRNYRFKGGNCLKTYSNIQHELGRQSWQLFLTDSQSPRIRTQVNSLINLFTKIGKRLEILIISVEKNLMFRKDRETEVLKSPYKCPWNAIYTYQVDAIKNDVQI